MAVALSISGVTCLLIVLSVLIKPNIKIGHFSISTYWIIALVGAILLFACGCISFKDFWASVTTSDAVNPLKILVIFFSMTMMSVFLDSVGFFRYFAVLAVKKANGKSIYLFLWLYLIVSVLTVFTSNDIIVLTFTPFICYFAKNAKINPLPFLITEFIAANTWSMILIIGNPTNIYLATSTGIAFLEYTKVMAIPTIFGGIVSFGVLFLLFRKELKTPLNPTEVEDYKVKDKPLMVIGLVFLLSCIILLVISSYVGLEMWYICLGALLGLIITVLLYKVVKRERPKELITMINLTPFQLAPFVLSMFAVVLALKNCGFTDIFANFLGETQPIMTYGVASTLVANLINNIPMSVLFSSILQGLTGETLTCGIFASVIGSNIGAFLTPIGALAGIMWSGMLNSHGVKFSFGKFVLYGVTVAIPTLFATLGGLYLSFLI